MKNSLWKYVPLEQGVNILDTVRQPINRKERMKRIENKEILYPYYGATGQVDYIDDYLLDGEYVLLGEDGAPFLNPLENKAYIVNGKFWVNNHAHILQSKTNNKFLCYYLNTVNYKELVTGTTRYKLTQAAMKRIIVPVPPLPEQERIVAHIEELFSELDAGVETLKKTKAQLDVYRQAVLKEAFENQDTCASHSLSELMLTVKNGYGIKPDDEGQYKILKISAVRAANLDLDEYRYNKMPFDNNYLIHENDLLFTRYNGSRELVGICAVVPRLKTTYAYPDKIIKCTPKLQNTFHSKYIQYYLSQGEPRKYIRSKTKTTSGQHGISGSDLKKARIYLPSIAEQEDIVRKIESRLSVCNNIEQTIDATLEQAKALRHSILKEAFEGSLVQ